MRILLTLVCYNSDRRPGVTAIAVIFTNGNSMDTNSRKRCIHSKAAAVPIKSRFSPGQPLAKLPWRSCRSRPANPRDRRFPQAKAVPQGLVRRSDDHVGLVEGRVDGLAMHRQVFARFDRRDDFSWKEMLDLVHNEPDLMKINAGVQHKTLKDIDKRALRR